MTARQYKRLRAWDLKTQSAYNAGVIEGMDAFYVGYPRPEDPDTGHDSPFDLSFRIWPGERLEQYHRNSQRARMRGAVDGWDQALDRQRECDEEDWIESGIAQFEDMLRQAA